MKKNIDMKGQMLEVLPYIHHLLEKNQKEINEWFAEKYSSLGTPLVYCSVDIRHAGFKLAPVDTNAFPAGFNNLNPQEIIKGSQALSSFLDHYFPDANNILVIPENHTRNKKYIDSLHVIEQLFENAEKSIVFGSTEIEETHDIESGDGHTVTVQALIKKDDKVVTKDGFNPDVIILNNDFTTGFPSLLEGLTQPILPSQNLGWHTRKKSIHFEEYSQLVSTFSRTFDFDPWLISALSHHCEKINFKEHKGEECIAISIDKLIHQIQKKYDEYEIKEQPYVFVKADQGTYGMGIMTVSSGDEMIGLNKKNRNKMNVIKGGALNTSVIIQEGVPTIDEVDGNPAEPLVYIVGNEPIGCFYRTHEERSKYTNLNAQGMTFKKASKEQREETCPVHGLIAKLANLATMNEEY